LSTDDFLPAVGQGIVRSNRARTTGLRANVWPHRLRDVAIALAQNALFLTFLDGSCRTPIAGHATITADRVRFAGSLPADGSMIFETEREGTTGDAAALGHGAGHDSSAVPAPDSLQRNRNGLLVTRRNRWRSVRPQDCVRWP